jgi:hypothetical protein
VGSFGPAPRSAAQALLSFDLLQVDSEETVLLAACSWLGANAGTMSPFERRHAAEQLGLCVRWQHLLGTTLDCCKRLLPASPPAAAPAADIEMAPAPEGVSATAPAHADAEAAAEGAHGGRHPLFGWWDGAAGALSSAQLVRHASLARLSRLPKLLPGGVAPQAWKRGQRVLQLALGLDVSAVLPVSSCVLAVRAGLHV